MGGLGTSWDIKGPLPSEEPGLGQDNPYSSAMARPGSDRPFTTTSPSRYEDHWARDEAPCQENWPGKLEVDEGSEEEDDALSYCLSVREIQQIWGMIMWTLGPYTGSM